MSIILKCNFKGTCREGVDLIYVVRKGTNDGCFQYDNETLGFIKYEESLDLLKVTLGFREM
jgi:hypothetical protein